MMTEVRACGSARFQYRAAFKQMACGGRWHFFATPSGITLDREGTHSVILAHDVQAKNEESAILALVDGLRRGIGNEVWK